MYQRARIYWLAWALLVVGAVATRVASVQDIFFQGAVGAFLAPLALPHYEKAGPRIAAFLGALTGALWVLILNEGWGRFMWDEAERISASARLDVQFSVAIAAFAGTALAAAMVHRIAIFPRAAIYGGLLSLAMTAVPYAVIHEVEYNRLGPIEITWFATAKQFDEQGRPVRPIGTLAPKISPDDIKVLRADYLTIDVGGETALVDTNGQRIWAVWRKRLTQNKHEGGPVRRVFIVNKCTDDASIATALEKGLRLPDEPDGICVLDLKDKDDSAPTEANNLSADAPKSEFSVMLKYAAYSAGKLSTDESNTVDPKELQSGSSQDLSKPKCHALWAVRRGLLENEPNAHLRRIYKSDCVLNFSVSIPDLTKPKPTPRPVDKVDVGQPSVR
ncbi:MAG TPA: hypothetical protein DCY41_03775 [Opitutae bacterium]|nr:hypothetical protein [Opitutae bacterium]